jgi:hypothetical protein
MAEEWLEVVVFDVDGDNGGSGSGGDLNCITPDAAAPHDDHEVTVGYLCTSDRLERCGDSVGDYSKVRELITTGKAVDDIETVGRHRDVSGEAAIEIIARHLLIPAHIPPTRLTHVTHPAGDYRRHHHISAHPVISTISGLNDSAAYLVTKDQGELGAGVDMPIEKAKIGMTKTATSDFDQDLSGFRLSGGVV